MEIQLYLEDLTARVFDKDQFLFDIICFVDEENPAPFSDLLARLSILEIKIDGFKKTHYGYEFKIK